MSAPLSCTASINVELHKGLPAVSSWSSDSNVQSSHLGSSAGPSDNRAEGIFIGVASKAPIPNPTPYFQPIRLLIVDESDQVRQLCGEAAKDFGFVAMEAETITAARQILERKDTAILMLDLTGPDGDRQSLVTEVKRCYPNVLLIGMSASATIASAVETMRTGACDYLSKPFPLHVLMKVYERAANRLCFDLEYRKLLQVTDNVPGTGDALGRSVETEKFYRMLSHVAGSRHPVMIVGEPGTSKALVARSIHSNGPDGSKPFVSVGCTLMSSTLLETKLFGRSKDASVDGGTRGLLAALEGGTVFLDGIESLNLDVQERLVRALKHKKIGPAEGHDLSVRIVAATTHDLTEMVRDGRFRMDLYRLLSLVNLNIPPLRGRPADIVFLAERFLERISRRTGIVRTMPPETLRVLETYDWPEDTRELEGAIGQAFMLSSGTELETNHLPQNILTFCRSKDAAQNLAVNPPPEPGIYRSQEAVIPITTMERKAILAALQRTKGDKMMAARLLGIGKTTLYRKLKEYSVHIPPESGVSNTPAIDSHPTTNASEMSSRPSIKRERSEDVFSHPRSVRGL